MSISSGSSGERYASTENAKYFVFFVAFNSQNLNKRKRKLELQTTQTTLPLRFRSFHVLVLVLVLFAPFQAFFLRMASTTTSSADDDSSVIELDTETLNKIDHGAQSFMALPPEKQNVVLGMSRLAGFDEATKLVYIWLVILLTNFRSAFCVPAMVVSKILDSYTIQGHFVKKVLQEQGKQSEDWQYFKKHEVFQEDFYMNLQQPYIHQKCILEKVGEDLHFSVPGQPNDPVIIPKNAGNKALFAFLKPDFARFLLLSHKKGRKICDFFCKIHDAVSEFLAGEKNVIGDLVEKKHQLTNGSSALSTSGEQEGTALMQRPVTLIERQPMGEELQLIVADRSHLNSFNVEVRDLEVEKKQAEVEYKKAEVEYKKAETELELEKKKAEAEQAVILAGEQTQSEIKRRKVEDETIELSLLEKKYEAKRKQLKSKIDELQSMLSGRKSKVQRKVLQQSLDQAYTEYASLRLENPLESSSLEAKEEEEKEALGEDKAESFVPYLQRPLGAKLFLEDVAFEMGVGKDLWKHFKSEMGNKARHLWEQRYPGVRLHQELHTSRQGSGRSFNTYVYNERDRDILEFAVGDTLERKGITLSNLRANPNYQPK